VAYAKASRLRHWHKGTVINQLTDVERGLCLGVSESVEGSREGYSDNPTKKLGLAALYLKLKGLPRVNELLF
jgi:hypothetical protein